MIISGVTQGMKNKDIAREVGTTEQVVKNYLRKIYDKLHVVDRLELALYSMHHRLLEGYKRRPLSADGSAPADGEPPNSDAQWATCRRNKPTPHQARVRHARNQASQQ